MVGCSDDILSYSSLFGASRRLQKRAGLGCREFKDRRMQGFKEFKDFRVQRFGSLRLQV